MEKFNAYKKRSVSRYRETTRFYGIGTKYSRYTEDEEKIILDRGYTDREIAKTAETFCKCNPKEKAHIDP